MLIGLCGIKGSGKSVVAEYISEHYGFKRINFKDELISHIKLRFPDVLKELSIIYSMTIDELFINKPPAMRALMVNIGTDDKRRDNPAHWADSWIKAVASSGARHVVADDVRFQNEFDKIKMNGGIVILVKRSDKTVPDDHPSETEHLSFDVDFVIEAEPGGHEAVYAQVRTIMETINRD